MIQNFIIWVKISNSKYRKCERLRKIESMVQTRVGIKGYISKTLWTFFHNIWKNIHKFSDKIRFIRNLSFRSNCIILRKKLEFDLNFFRSKSTDQIPFRSNGFYRSISYLSYASVRYVLLFLKDNNILKFYIKLLTRNTF